MPEEQYIQDNSQAEPIINHPTLVSDKVNVNRVGRPSEYSTDILDKVVKYIESCVDEEREVMNADKLTTKLDVNLPTIEGLAVYLGISRDTIYDWETKYSEFSDIIEILRAEQAKRLANKGLSGDYNPTIAKLMMMKHGYREKQDITSDGHAILPTPIYVPRDLGPKENKQITETN